MTQASDVRPARRVLRPRILAPGAALAVVALAALLVVFQPWKLVIDDVVDEALPTAAASAPATPSAPSASTAPEPTTGATTATPVETARGSFVSHEHATTGTVRLLVLADGSRVLRIEGLDTSNGPDLRVWLSDQPVIDGRDGWFVFDDGEYVELGRLKGNRGSQNYAVPSDVDLASLTSVSIWCARFHVSFGAAALVAA